MCVLALHYFSKQNASGNVSTGLNLFFQDSDLTDELHEKLYLAPSRVADPGVGSDREK